MGARLWGEVKKSACEVSVGIFSKGIGERLVNPSCSMAGPRMPARAQRKVSREGSSVAQSGFLHSAKERAVSHQGPSYNHRYHSLSSQNKVSLWILA